MIDTEINRREMMRLAFASGGTVVIRAEPLAALAAGSSVQAETARRLKVVCVGGHPDDPESGCAGTLALYTQAGHEVTVVYLTRGERGIRGKSNDEAAVIRSAECEAACKVIGAKPAFAGQVDGSTVVDSEWAGKIRDIVAAEGPDILFTHWPIDTHMDHQAAAVLTYRAWLSLNPRPQLYFFEVNLGSQTQGFSPNVYVDIGPVLEKKKEALFAHVSQDGQNIWRKHHEVMAAFRGREAGFNAAEAFVQLKRQMLVGNAPGL